MLTAAEIQEIVDEHVSNDWAVPPLANIGIIKAKDVEGLICQVIAETLRAVQAKLEAQGK